MAGAPIFSKYKPDKREYQRPSNASIVARVKIAREMATGVREIGEQAKQDQAVLTDSIDHMVNLFKSKVNLGVPEDKMYVGFNSRSAKPADVIFRVMGMLSTTPVLQYVSPDENAKAREIADKIEAHINNLDPWMERTFDNDYRAKSIFWRLLAGRSYVQQSYLPYHWDKQVHAQREDETDAEYNARWEGYKAHAGPPFMRESLDPRTVFPILTPRGIDGYVKHYKVQRYSLLDSFERAGKRLVFDTDGKFLECMDVTKAAGLELPIQSPDQLSTTTEYWELIDDVFVYYIVDDQVVHEYQHNGSLCIAPGYGLRTGIPEHDVMGVGLLWAVRNEIPQFDFLRTLWMQKAYLEVFPQLVAQLAEGESPLMGDDNHPTEWNVEPGTIKQIRGKLANAFSDAASGVDFRAFVDMISTDIDTATLPGAARGMAGAQTAGYTYNQQMQALRTQWKPIIRSIEYQDSYLAEKYLTAVRDEVGEDVTLFAEIEDEEEGRRKGVYMTLEREKIHPYFRVVSHVNPELPIDKQGQIMTGAALVERGHITHEEYTREFLEKTSPETRRKKLNRDAALRAFLPKAVEDAMALGQVKLTNRVLEERGLDRLNELGNLDLQALKAARAQQQPTAPGDVQGGQGGAMQQGQGQPGLGEGNGIPPTLGANQANPTPGPRMT